MIFPAIDHDEKGEDNVVFVGKKEVMAYVLAVVTRFGQGESRLVLKARGRSISKAVDVAEVVKNRFMADLVAKDIAISTEEIEDERGIRRVSSIQIPLCRG